MKSARRLLISLRQHLLLTIVGLIFLVGFVGALLFYFIEFRLNPHLESFPQAIWWALVSMTTVGYGDVVPVTGVGRLLGIFIIFMGVALVSVFTATISSIFVAQKLKEEHGLKQIVETGHIILCGWNFSAEQILSVILNRPSPAPVVMINQLPEDQIHSILLKFKGKPLHYVRGDYAQEEVLNRANLTGAHTVLIIPDASSGLTARSDEKTILTAFSVKALQPKIKVFAHILDADNEPYLKKAQVDNYIVSDAFSGTLLGKMVTDPGVPQSLQSLLQSGNAERLERIPLPKALAGKTFGEAIAYFREKNMLPVALVREQKPLSLSDIMSEDYSYLDEFIERKFREAGRSLKKGLQLDVNINPPDDTVLDEEHSLVIIK